MTVRNLARFGATSVLVCGALGLAATPALAADVDLGVGVTGTTVAAGAQVKLVKVNIANKGTSTPTAVNVIFDVSKLDKSKVQLVPDNCKTAGTLITCGVEKALLPAPGGSSDLPVGIVRLPGSSGSAGKLTVTVKTEGDAQAANDSKTVAITLSPEKGVDFGVFVADVTTADAKDEPTGEPVAPGGVGALLAQVVNTGDLTAQGVKVTFKLPPQTTVAQKLDGCRLSADKRTLTCEDAKKIVQPVNGDNSEDASFALSIGVRVSAKAKGPVALKGGSVTVTAIKQVSASARGSLASEAAPAEPTVGFVPLTAAQIAKIDADLSDNTDGFAVLVAATGGGGGGENGAGQGDGGGLPLTGPAAYAIGGSGLAVLAVGLVLFFSARRRRVVMVAPGDEK